jgi:hypothetical protein
VFTAKKVEFVERRMVEHLLKKPCFIDSGDRPRAASILLEYEPSYKSFQKRPIVKNFRHEEVTVARPGKGQEEIIQAVPVTAKRGAQVPQLVAPLIDPDFVPSLDSSEVGDPVIWFPSLFNPTHQTEEDMPIQRRSIDIGAVLGTSVPQSSETSSLPPPPGFSQMEDVMRRKRKRGEGEGDEDEGGQELPPTEPLKKKPPSKKGKGKSDRALQRTAGQAFQQLQHRNNPKEPWSYVFQVDGRPIDEGDSVLKSGNVRGGQVADAVRKALLLLEDMKVW